MNKAILVISSILIASSLKGQVSGNVNYRVLSNQSSYEAVPFNIPSILPDLQYSPPGDNTFTIKGLYNCKADSYLAIFSLTQVGKTQKELTQVIDAKLDTIRQKMVKKNIDAKLFIDMISFVPVYEMEVSKKLFSTTYNEIPKGFELKKNLHFSYSDPAVLDLLVSICADQEIYDLVRVDYTINNIEEKREEMVQKAMGFLDKKMDRYEILLRDDFEDKERLLVDGFKMHYPTEQYSSYQAYCSNSMNYSSDPNSTTVVKTTSLYYMPLRDKGYDFVVNSGIHEPVVQLEYEIKLRLYPKAKEAPVVVKEVIKEKAEKEIFLITPNAEIKKLNF